MLKILFERELHVLNRKVTFGELKSFIKKSFSKVPENYCIYYRDADDDKIELTSEGDLNVMYECSDRAMRLVVQRRPQEPELLEVNEASDDEVVVIEDVTSQLSHARSTDTAATSKTLSASEIESLIKSCLAEIVPDLTKKIQSQVECRLKVPAKQAQKQVVHEHVRCDGCKVKPIIGIRYKCAICHDFDFCENCESAADHPHPFLKIRYPEQAPKSLMVCIEDDNQPGIEVNGTCLGQQEIPTILKKFIPSLNEPEHTPQVSPVIPVVPPPKVPLSEEEILIRAHHLEDLFELAWIDAVDFTTKHEDLADKEALAQQWFRENS